MVRKRDTAQDMSAQDLETLETARGASEEEIAGHGEEEISSPDDFEKELRASMGDSFVDNHKRLLDNRDMEFTKENLLKIPKIYEDNQREITKLQMERADQERQPTFQPGGVTPQPPGGEQANPFLMQFANDPERALDDALMKRLGTLANVNQERQKIVMNLEEKMLETHPDAPQIIPTFERYVMLGKDPDAAWDKAELNYLRGQRYGAIRKMGANREKAKAGYVEGSGGAGELPPDVDWDNLSAEEMRKEIIKRGGRR